MVSSLRRLLLPFVIVSFSALSGIWGCATSGRVASPTTQVRPAALTGSDVEQLTNVDGCCTRHRHCVGYGRKRHWVCERPADSE